MTRSKLLEQVKIVGDGTAAFAKGTASTMVLVTTGSNKRFRLATLQTELMRIMLQVLPQAHITSTFRVLKSI